jgi:phosphoglycolate phosphatase
MRAVIFDLDGTLADSAPDIAAALNRAFVEAGFAPFELDAVKSMVGAGARTLVARALKARMAAVGRSDVERLHHRFVAHYEAQPCVATQLYPGALEALASLKAEGYQLGICTNKPQALADQVLKSLGIAGLFGSTVGGRDGIALKPAPDMVHLVLRELNVSASQAILIGDSAADVGAAHAAGLPVIVLAHGYADTPAAGLGANICRDGFDGLIAAINKLCVGDR